MDWNDYNVIKYKQNQEDFILYLHMIVVSALAGEAPSTMN